MDSDSGLEFGDDLMYSTEVRVPWCSAFHAEVATADCGEAYEYECDAQVRVLQRYTFVMGVLLSSAEHVVIILLL